MYETSNKRESVRRNPEKTQEKSRSTLNKVRKLSKRKYPKNSPESKWKKKRKAEIGRAFREKEKKVNSRIRISHEQLQEVRNNFHRVEVNQENLHVMNEKIYNLIKHHPEERENPFKLQLEDRFVYNEELKEISVLRADKLVYRIRFTPYTAQEIQEKKNAFEQMQAQNKAKNFRENKPVNQEFQKSPRQHVEVQGRNLLADWLSKCGAWPGKANSCGASCGEILNHFGFKDIIAQSGRDGKNWGMILQKPPMDQYFRKVPCVHPKYAKPGSVVFYEAGAGKSKRQTYGHVEIKGYNEQYYFYKIANQPGGSAYTNSENPQTLKKVMGYPGYCFEFIGKEPPKPQKIYQGKK